MGCRIHKYLRTALAPSLGAVALAIPLGGMGTAVAADPCPNQALRSGPSAQLPDCRGYEMVSPPEKNGYDVLPQVTASSEGSRVALRSYGAFSGSGSAGLQTTYLAARDSGGAWALRPISPLVEPTSFVGQANFLDWSPDLSKAILQGPPYPPLTAGATPGVPNLYLRDNGADSYTLVTPGLLPIPTVFNPEYEPVYGGSSSDFEHVVFGIGIPLPADIPVTANSNIYESAGGRLSLVDVLPGGVPAPQGANLGSGSILFGPPLSGSADHAVSDDGSTIFFTSRSTEGLFARLGGTETVPISASQKTPLPNPNPAQPATYWTAAADGSSAFFTSRMALTNDANTGPTQAGNDLYRYDLGAKRLTDLSADAADPNGAAVLGVVGSSADGAYAYFVARGRLVGGQGTLGAPNLYVWHNGSVRYIATLSEQQDGLNWTLHRSAFAARLPARVSADGKQMLVTTFAPQPGYDNTDPASGARHSEVYLYDADLAATTPSQAWRCISCDPSGAAATGDASIVPPNIPFAAAHDQRLTRVIGGGNRAIFFNSGDALVPQDVNRTTDVYEWQDGAIHLISTGTSAAPSYFADADPSGENVFIATRQQLLPGDRDDLLDIYDARIGGGTVAVPAAPPPCGAGDSCRGGSVAAPEEQPQSSVFTGPGNPKPPKRKHRKHHKKRHHRRG